SSASEITRMLPSEVTETVRSLRKGRTDSASPTRGNEAPGRRHITPIVIEGRRQTLREPDPDRDD
ncbi:MAG TPA: hypothetical protein VM261_38465, partial [Kofleriaceae bacterium]|nr:hypothetical protein [Kofleriaceae bacterium]